MRNHRMPLSKPTGPEQRDISAESKLLWQQLVGPVEQVAVLAGQALAATQNVAATQIAEREGVDPADGWRFDVRSLKLVKMPQPKE